MTIDELIKNYSRKLNWLLGNSIDDVGCLKRNIKDEDCDVTDIARQLHERLIAVSILRTVLEDLKELKEGQQ